MFVCFLEKGPVVSYSPVVERKGGSLGYTTPRRGTLRLLSSLSVGPDPSHTVSALPMSERFRHPSP